MLQAFNTVGREVMENPLFGADHAFMPVAGNEKAARDTIVALAKAIGFNAVDVGALKKARYLEALAMLWIGLGRGIDSDNLGPHFAFKVVTK